MIRTTRSTNTALSLVFCWILFACFPAFGIGQEIDQTPGEKNEITFSNPVESKWKVGTKIIGGAKPALNVLITLPVPTDWPEQKVTFDDVVVDSQSRVLDDFRTIDGAVDRSEVVQNAALRIDNNIVKSDLLFRPIGRDWKRDEHIEGRFGAANNFGADLPF